MATELSDFDKRVLRAVNRMLEAGSDPVDQEHARLCLVALYLDPTPASCNAFRAGFAAAVGKRMLQQRDALRALEEQLGGPSSSEG